MRRDQVAVIFDQLLLGQCIDQPGNGARADEGQYETANALDQSMSAL